MLKTMEKIRMPKVGNERIDKDINDLRITSTRRSAKLTNNEAEEVVFWTRHILDVHGWGQKCEVTQNAKEIAVALDLIRKEIERQLKEGATKTESRG